MRAKEAKTGVAHEASSRREGGTVRPDRRERVRRSAGQRVRTKSAECRDAKHHKTNAGGGLATGEVAEVGALPLLLEVDVGSAASAVGMAGPDPCGAGGIQQLNVNDDVSAGAVDILKDEVRAVAKEGEP